MTVYGCQDPSLSEFLKCAVSQGDVTVIGQMDQGISSSLQHNWQSPFQADGGGGVMDKGLGLLQHMSGRTTKGFLSFLRTWEGSEPETFSIPLMFEAVSDPEKEVDLAVRYLKAMSSPRFSHEIKGAVDDPGLASAIDFVKNKMASLWKDGPGNRVPQTVTVGMGRRFILRKVQIDSVEVDDPVRRNKDGFSIKQSVTLNIATRSVQDAVDILARGVKLPTK